MGAKQAGTSRRSVLSRLYQDGLHHVETNAVYRSHKGRWDNLADKANHRKTYETTEPEREGERAARTLSKP